MQGKTYSMVGPRLGTVEYDRQSNASASDGFLSRTFQQAFTAIRDHPTAMRGSVQVSKQIGAASCCRGSIHSCMQECAVSAPRKHSRSCQQLCCPTLLVSSQWHALMAISSTMQEAG